MRIIFRYAVQKNFFKRAAQIQVFQPDQIALIFDTLKNGFKVCNAGKNRRDKADRADAGP